MTAFDLSRIGPGFVDPLHEAQRVFRSGLEALSHPGRVLNVSTEAVAPKGVSTTANALLLALLDQDTVLWVSPAAGDTAAQHLRFHTGCRIASTSSEADFILLAVNDPWPESSQLRLGSEYSPEQSATLVREVSKFGEGVPLALAGPGIPTLQILQCPELDAGFVASWQAMRGHFPRGIDLFLTCGNALAGLPRSTRLTLAEEASCM